MHRTIDVAAALFAAAMFILVASSPSFAADASDAEVMGIMRAHCVMCHARKPTHPSFAEPPKNVYLETIDDVKAWAQKVLEQVVLDRNMPIGNETGMTEADREAIARWAEKVK